MYEVKDSQCIFLFGFRTQVREAARGLVCQGVIWGTNDGLARWEPAPGVACGGGICSSARSLTSLLSRSPNSSVVASRPALASSTMT